MDKQQIIKMAAIERERLERSILPQNVASLFDRSLEMHADRVLWHSADNDIVLSYREFGTCVHQSAAAFRRLGVKRKSHVGIMLPNVPAFVISWMALARLGAVMIPINVKYTRQELQSIVANGDIEFLVIDHAYVDLAANHDNGPILPRTHIVVHGQGRSEYGESWTERLQREKGRTIPAEEIDPDSLMSIMFTSGTTGLPKGCMLPHRYWTTIAHVRTWQGPAFERIWMDRPFYYMGGQWRFLAAVLLGARVVVAARPTIRQMLDKLIEYEIDFCVISPLVAKEPFHPQSERIKLKWAGTMAVPRDLHCDLVRRLNGAPVCEQYGLTETGAVLGMPAYADSIVGSGSVGLPVPFRACRIVDEKGVDVSSGKTGELWVKGPGMMQGYFKQPEATAKVMSGEWFRTGDLFSRDSDGFYSVIGRLKDVIRRSGENISPAEIEHTVSAMSEVADAAAVPVPDGRRDEEVKLYVVLRDGVQIEQAPPQAIYAFCKERLAAFKLPRYVSYVESLPKNASGKTSKHELVNGVSDLRAGSYDLVDATWR